MQERSSNKSNKIKLDILKIATKEDISMKTKEELEPLFRKYGKKNVLKVLEDMRKEHGWLSKTFGKRLTIGYRGKDFLEEDDKRIKKALPKERLLRALS